LLEESVFKPLLPSHGAHSPTEGSATVAGVSGILARAQLAVFHQTRTADVAARRNDGRGRLQRGNASLGRTLLPEYPDITLYIEHLRSRISNEPLEEVRCASPFFLRAWMSVVISEK